MQPCFAADAMLGRLARWLRALGYDTFYEAGIADPLLVQRAEAQGRIVLTRDRLLLRELQPRQSLEIRHDAPLQQLREVVDALALAPPAALFTRCMLDNAPLCELLAAVAPSMLPPGVRDLPGPVRRCPSCARVYWEGSHARRMRAALERGLPEWVAAR